MKMVPQSRAPAVSWQDFRRLEGPSTWMLTNLPRRMATGRSDPSHSRPQAKQAITGQAKFKLNRGTRDVRWRGQT
jgi:hypothetical protein